MKVFEMDRMTLRAALLAVLCGFYCVCGADCLAQDAGKITQSRVDSAAVHFWDNVDLSDSTLYALPVGVSAEESFSAMEEKVAGFFALLGSSSDSVAIQAVSELMDRALEATVTIRGTVVGSAYGSPDPYGFFLSAAEKYFYSVQSPYYNEEMLLPFLDHKIAREDIAEIEKSREKFLVAQIKRNMVGSMAEDFAFELGDGKSASLYKVLGGLSERQSLMIVFFSADCRDCKDGIARLKYSPAVSKKISEDEFKVLAVCVEGRLKDVLSIIPDTWFKASDDGGIIINSIYSIRHQPSVYILDREGVIQLKDADVSSAIDYLINW